ncbi:glycosyltransferase [Nakamurella endophytica]|uniref:Glycosyl transferase family 1 n=1 Tax=Nakamurella endophytica TaxID=1748367 RepID=A0A917SPQ3_9ACTN|nr:glycosyltransferase [Nakamurella endophytica]GGL91419.1 glycosyl transferase family 1 [Nakamurella endophytica]
MPEPDRTPGGSPDAAVLAWRDYWLAPSETFIRDQVTGLTRWRPVLVGRRTFDKPLVTPDYAPWTDRWSHRVASRLPSPPGVRRRYRRLFGDPAVEVVHAHFGTDGVSALPWADAAGKPLVVSFYGMDVTSMAVRRDAAAVRYRRALPRLFDRAHTLLTVSDFLAGRLVDLGAPQYKIRMQYPGTVVGEPAPDGERSGVVFVGRFVDKKGVPDLLAAVAMLPEPLRSVPVTLVGYGPLEDELRRTAQRLGLDATFTGRLPSPRIAEVLRRNLVFCGPSRVAPDGDAEGLGMVFVEAALAGLPVVSYRHGGVPEAVADGRTGLLAPEGDVAALSRHLGALLADPDAARAMGRAGRARAVATFELGDRTRVLEDLYDEVAGRPRPDGRGGRTTTATLPHAGERTA